MKYKRMTALLLVAAMMFTTAYGSLAANAPESDGAVRVIALSSSDNGDGTWSHSATFAGKEVKEYDYTWHVDPSKAHDEVKDAPAEYYTGAQPQDEAVYIAHDIFYYPQLPQEDFKLVQYDDDREWAYYYTAQGYESYIFATLPSASGMGRGTSAGSFPTQMMHSAQEAYENAVLHITEAGVYSLEGSWHGQIWIDLGDTDDTFADPAAKVTLLLNGVDVTCTVAPALIFYSVYECDNTWEDRDSYTAAVDTADAGANVVIVDGTVNDLSGTNVYRMLKTTYKKDGATQKKQRKTDAAFYSYVTMNVNGGAEGTGVLNITSGFEGLDSELHLTLNGGNVNIFSQDDGVNVNEDGVSVVTFNGGNVHILAGLGSEGDGVDSNGFLVVNGGTVISMANPASDAGLDSDCGSYVNGGTVVALGSTMDWAETDENSDSNQAVMNLQFSSYQSSDEAIILTDLSGKVVFAYDPDKDEVAGSRARQYRGAVVSSPALRPGESYHLYVGGDVTGTETAGVYDANTVTGFTEDAKQQCWNGTWEQTGGRFGMGGRGEWPDGSAVDRGQRPDFRPDGGDPANLPEPPDESFGDFGFDPGQMGQRPDDMGRPDDRLPARGTPDPYGSFVADGSAVGGGRGDRFDGEPQTGGTGSVEFALTKATNSFSGVSDYAGLPFVDLNESMAGFDAVRSLYGAGVMQGTGADTFSPDMTVTRAQAITALARLAGAAEAQTDIFTDVEQNSWYSGFVGWAVEQGIVEGDGQGHFFPSMTVTAQQMELMLGRFSAAYVNETSFTGELTRIQLAQMLVAVM